MRIGRTAVQLGACGLWMLGASVALAQLQPCPEKSRCFQIAVGSPPEPSFPGGIVSIPISVQPAASDGAPGGVDEISAVRLSVSIPGLELADCSNPDQNGLNPSFAIPAGIADQFLVFVENTSCAGRDRCLCPDEGQTRDEFINIAVSGPRDIHDPEIPTLSAGVVLSISLRVRDDAPADVPLHVFSETDDPKGTPKPKFAEFVSLGDDQAVDVTADRKANVSRVRVIDADVVVSNDITPTAEPTTAAPTGSPTVPPTGSPTVATATVTPTAESTPTGSPVETPVLGCPGDCDASGSVSIDELIRGVAIALGRDALADCAPIDSDRDGSVTIDELVRAVNAAVSGCAD